MSRRRFAHGFTSLALVAASAGAAGCGASSTQGTERVTGQSEFVSAPPYGASNPNAFGNAGGGVTAADAGASAPTSASAGSGSASTTTTRTVQETDLYRFDASTNRLYYLNAYRGLMVFDVSVVDHPKLLGRSPIFGSPVQMFVDGAIAVVVVADWYGTMDDGTPFHGSIVRGLDATDPAHIQVLGEAKLGGWVQDTRVVGSVLYAVSQDYGWVYGWADGWGDVGGAVSNPTSNVIVSSVDFAGGNIQQVGSKQYPGYGGVFNVTPDSIMLAHPSADAQGTVLQYLDISDPAGAIVERGSLQVPGSLQGWGADNGRWNLDFADGQTAHVVGCASSDGASNGYIVDTVDFSNPDQPVLDSQLAIPPSDGWTATARFDGTRLYLSPQGGYYYGTGSTTPLEIVDLSNPLQPAVAGQTSIPGSVWILIPSGNQLFALGQDTTGDSSTSAVSLKYVDVTDAANPSLIGTSTFGDGWAWTPAADTFKAFTMDPTQGLVVLPFSGWSYSSQQYNNGVQLIEYTPTSIATAGAAHTQGWVERGIFVNGRILSLSDLALSVVDYSNPLAPAVTGQLTLARNVIAAQPAGATVAEISSDWWGNDTSQSEVRVLPASDAAVMSDESQAPDLTVPGADASVYTNGSLVYVVTASPVTTPCPAGQDYPTGYTCTSWQERVQVVDTSNGTATARGSVALPIDPIGYGYYWGWYGFYDYDWYGGGEIAQVGSDALAFRRWHPTFSSTGQYVSASNDLFVVDLSNPDAPSVASTTITNDPYGWWGNMRVVGDTLYTTHYVWPYGADPNPTVRYYLDSIDLHDRAHPAIGASYNVPGVLVGGSDSDPSTLYMVDYGYFTGGGSTVPHDSLDVVKLSGGSAFLQSTTPLDGWVGNVIVRGTTAYASAQPWVTYDPNNPGYSPPIELHQIDLGDPSQPVDHVVTGSQGWGWLLDVQGDRMLVTSGWGSAGLDVYRLSPGAAPSYDQFVRTIGWTGSASRQGNTLYLTSGEWGVQVVNLQ